MHRFIRPAPYVRRHCRAMRRSTRTAGRPTHTPAVNVKGLALCIRHIVVVVVVVDTVVVVDGMSVMLTLSSLSFL